MKKLFILFIIIGMASLATGAYYFNNYNQFLKSPVYNETQIINITKGQSYQGFVNSLIQTGANGKKWQWKMFARLEKVDKFLKAGEFKIIDGLTPMEVMTKINQNDVIKYNFTIIEGMNWRDLKAKLLNDPVLIKTLSNITDEDLLNEIGSDKSSVEGLFLPETYQFTRGDSDVQVLKRAYKALTIALDKYWQEKDDDLPYKSKYELLTMASIVEKETAQANERGTIAGVFVRRLHLNMRLQTDPTVIYGVGEAYDGDITSAHLKTDTPYNTYTRNGLTPTPIAMASIESIIASAHPEAGKYLYFVANNQGGHYFSKTYAEHQQAVKKFLKGMKL